MPQIFKISICHIIVVGISLVGPVKFYKYFYPSIYVQVCTHTYVHTYIHTHMEQQSLGGGILPWETALTWGRTSLADGIMVGQMTTRSNELTLSFNHIYVKIIIFPLFTFFI